MWRCALLVVIACNNPARSAEDAGAANDATGDRDGDGILDELDVCPDVADPSQLDLDGDGLGWMCDPSESTTLPFHDNARFALDVHRSTFAAAIVFGCPMAPNVPDQCQQDVLAVGPAGWKRILSSSTSPEEAWTKVAALTPFISEHERVYWSQSYREIGELELASGSFISRYPGFIVRDEVVSPVTEEGAPVVITAGTNPATFDAAILEPRADGALLEIAKSTGAAVVHPFVDPSWPALMASLVDMDGPSIKSFTPGNMHLDLVQVNGVPMTQLSDVRFGGDGANAAYCAIRNGTYYYVEVSAQGARGDELPDAHCFHSRIPSRSERVHALIGYGSVAYAVDGQVRRLLTDPSASVEFVGYETPVAIVRRQAGTLAYYAIDSTGVAQELANGVSVEHISSEGSTVHILGSRGDNHVLIRYRVGQAPQEIPVLVDPSVATLVTSKEGAAIVAGFGVTFVFPSQATTPVEFPFDQVTGAPRGDYTVLLVKQSALMAQRIVAYVEDTSGAPRFVELATPSPTSASSVLWFLDREPTRPFPPSDWFIHQNELGCFFARPTTSGGAVTLASSPCGPPSNSQLRGFTASGKQVVMTSAANRTNLFLLDATSAEKVAVATGDSLHLMVDGRNRILGWYGRDVNLEGFICLASHPDRCWSAPFAMFASGSYWTKAGDGGPDAFHFVHSSAAGGTVTFTSIKSIGTGNRSQPL